MRRRQIWITLICFFVLTVLAGIANWPGGPDLDLNKIGINYRKELNIRRGLDLQGGTHLVYEGDISKIDPKDRENAMTSLRNNIEKRVNIFGVAEPNIYTSTIGDKRRLVVELPGITDVNQAIELIGKTAKLEFKEPEGEISQGQFPTAWKESILGGQHLTRADVDFDPNTNEPVVELTFNNEGAKIFGEITTKNVNKPVGIFLDDELISAPRVNEAITSGKAQITGQFTLEQAKKMSIQLNAGALPVSINLVEQRNIGATLGQDSVKKSVLAGLIGVIIVGLFMLIYYRFLGFLATISLLSYALITLAIFKFSSITLTLSGIAGFILGVGMAMEATVLVFERVREELRKGKIFSLAVEDGYKGAWSGIWVSNVVSFIICIILWFGGGMIRGFALTLGISIITSLLVVYFITRTLLYFVIGNRFTKKPKLLAVEEVTQEG